MIEDAELRDLFQIECGEHLQMLDSGLLRIEAAPDDQSALEELFRAAHSLKGTARMLGVSGVERIAHHMEDELDGARRGRAVLNQSHLDRYAIGLSAMRDLVAEAVGQTHTIVDVDHVVGQVTGQIALGRRAQPEKSATQPVEFADADSRLTRATPEIEPAPEIEAPQETLSRLETLPVALPIAALPIATPPEALPQESLSKIETSGELAPRAADEFKIQTMRVAPAKLDALMTLSSELAVTSTRVLRGMTAFEEIGALCEEWSKDLAPNRPLWQEATGASPTEMRQQLGAFQAREQGRLQRLQSLWEELQQGAYQNVTRLGLLADELEAGIRNVRLLPLSQVFGLFPRLVRDLARELDKEIDFRVEGGDIAVDKRILEEIKDPLMHMLRNAIDHGIAPPDEREKIGKPRAASLRLRALQSANSVVIELQDDGRGLDVAAIKSTALARGLHSAAELDAMTTSQLHLLIFAPGFSTSTLITDLSGRGVGLDVVAVNIERLKGTIRVQSELGKGTTFSIRLPSTLATTRVLLVSAAGRTFALPVESIQTILRVESEQIFSVEGRANTVFESRALPLAPLSSLLELPGGRESGGRDAAITVVVESGDARLGVQVEALIDEQEVMLKPLGALLTRVRNVSGVTILGAGEVCLVLGVADLIKSALRRGAARELVAASPPEIEAVRKVILLAEDSITTRTQEKRILESAGYEVVTAVDGADAFAKLAARDFDALVSDVEMPNMDGLTLAARIRQNPRYNEMPIILVTSLSSDEDKRRGMEIGANAYLTKGTFEQKVLLDTLGRLI